METKESSFKTVGEAMDYCKEFGYDVHPMEAFKMADLLKRVYETGFDNGMMMGFVSEQISGCRNYED